MLVTVELQTYLGRYSPDGEPVFQFELPEGASVLSLLSRLKIPEEQASVIVLNDRSGDFDDALQDGDRVTLIPPLSGG